jgi:hypothetical protein
MTIYFKIEVKDNKRLVAVMYTTKREEDFYLGYKEYERLFDISHFSIGLRFFGNVDIVNTAWINLYYKNNK